MFVRVIIILIGSISLSCLYMRQTYGENGVVDKSGIPHTSAIWFISTYAVSVWRNGPNWLVTEI